MVYRDKDGKSYNVRYEHFPDTGDEPEPGHVKETIWITSISRDGIDLTDTLPSPLFFRITKAVTADLLRQNAQSLPRPRESTTTEFHL